MAKAAVAMALVGFLWWYLRPGRVWNVLLQAQAMWVALGGLMGAAGLGVQWLKWQRLLDIVRPNTTRTEGLESLLIGFGLGLVSPGRVGELGRGLFLGGDRASLVGLAGMDRFSSFVVAAVLAWVALLLLSPAAGGWVSLLLVVSGWLASRCLGRLRSWVGSGGFVGQAWAVFGRLPGPVWRGALAWSALFNLVLFAQFAILLHSWGQLSWRVLKAVPLVFCLKALLPVSFLDLGVREGAAVLVLSKMQLDPAVAFNTSILIFFINVLLPGLVGLVLVWRRARCRLGA